MLLQGVCMAIPSMEHVTYAEGASHKVAVLFLPVWFGYYNSEKERTVGS